MKILAGVMALLAVIYFLPAFMQRTDDINGHSRETAYRSAIKVKRYLSTNDRVIFDTAFGILDKIKSEEGPDAFINAVDGKTPEEIIEMAKHEVNVKIATGHPDFKQYASWDDMVEKLTKGKEKPSRQNGASAQPLRNSVRPGRPE
jgi:hypothetical protein